LDVMEGSNWCGCAKRFVGQMAVIRHVNQKDKRWEVDQETQFLGAKEATAMLSHVCAEAMKGYRKARNVESILDEDAFTIQINNHRPPTLNRDVGIIVHPNVQAGNFLV
jgi:hypothetical protein